MKQTTNNRLQSMLMLAGLLAAFGMICPGQETATPKNIVMVSANLFCSANADYRQVYGPAVFMPEIKITRLVYRNFIVWGSFAFIAKNGFIEEVDEQAKIRRTMLGFGIGYALKLNVSLRLRAELGLTSIAFKEEALGGTFKGSGLGWNIGANLDYLIGKKLFATLTTGYSGASAEAETGKIKLGGFQAGAGLGFTF